MNPSEVFWLAFVGSALGNAFVYGVTWATKRMLGGERS